MGSCPACTSDVPDRSRYCGHCGSAVAIAESQATQTSVPDSAPTPPNGRGSRVSPAARRLHTTDVAEDHRFAPGAMFGGRYRIVGLLGTGGMGELYRADDLKLGQPVALKFLPEEVQRDPSRIQRLINEVRVARQVSHPNVCRVYDIGEADPSTGSGQGGLHYISMEYVDGEDLSSLLRRIGRLPDDKAIELARQIGAGLAAAHGRGVIHRDLKPGNVMIDGQGQARITDFGLAGLAEEFHGAEIRVGTPAYMSPEQIAGKEVTERSDIFSLGLLLYELFTGKPVFDASTPAELVRQRKSAPTTPSSLVATLDPLVERIILRCMDPDPDRRPRSALAVVAALPGGDPLAAALAAGETPSPEMVAAAGPEGGLQPGVALACLGAILAGIVVVALLLGKSTLYNLLPMERPIYALMDDAKEIIAKLGYDSGALDTSCSLVAHQSALQYFAEQDSSAARWEPLKQPGQIGVYFFHRQATRPMVPLGAGGMVNMVDPALSPGDIILTMGLEGRLLRFHAVPPFVEFDDESAEPADWPVLFEVAGLDIADFEPTAPTVQPLTFADERAAWTGVLPHRDDLSVRVEAAALRGRPFFFETVTPYDPYWSLEAQQTRAGPALVAPLRLGGLAVGILAVVGAMILALRNWGMGRGDRRGSLRLALFVAGSSLLYWAFTGHHAPSFPAEIYLFGVALSRALVVGLLAWMLYMAIEPYARRLWPEALVSWSRLLAGRVRDPLVGRDLLIGFGFGIGILVLENLAVLVPGWLGLPPPAPYAWGLDALSGGRWALGQLFSIQLVSLYAPLGYFVMFLLLRIILRKQWLAAVVFCGLVAARSALGFVVLGSGKVPTTLVAFGVVVGAVAGTIMLVLLVRFGLLAAAGAFLMVNVLATFPITLDPSKFFFGVSVMGLVFAVIPVLYAAYVALAGRPLLRDPLLSE